MPGGVTDEEISDRGAEVRDEGLIEFTTVVQIAVLASIVPNITKLRAASLFLFTVWFAIAKLLRIINPDYFNIEFFHKLIIAKLH